MFADAIAQHIDKFFMGTTVLCGLACLYLFNSARALKASKAYSADVIDALQEGFYTSSLDGKLLSANPALVRLNGYKNEAEMLAAIRDIGAEWYVDPTRRDKFKDTLYKQGKVNNFVSEVYRHKTRERIWISENARLVCDPITLEPLHYEGTVRDITDEIKRRDSEERLNKLADNLPGGLFQIMLSPDGSYTAPYLSRSFLRLLEKGTKINWERPNDYLKFIHEDDIHGYLTAFANSAQTFEPVNYQFRFSSNDNELKWLHVTATPEALADRAILWHGHVSDITPQKLNELKVERAEYCDVLTGLPGRAALENKLAGTIALCDRGNDYAGLFFFHLSDVKGLSDPFGREVGDELLLQAAERLGQVVRAEDYMSRPDDDKLAVLVDELGENEEDASANARLLADKFLGLLQEEFILGDYRHRAQAAIGISLIDNSLPEASDIIHQAEKAMHKAKANGPNSYAAFGQNSPVRKDELAPQQQFDVALGKNEFELYFQPQFSDDRELVGAQALIYWDHPQLGLLQPDEFLPAAKSDGLTPDLGEWILDAAIRQLSLWKEGTETAFLGLSVEICVQQFFVPNFIGSLAEKLERSGIDRPRLTLELNESVVHRNTKEIQKPMLKAKKSGIRFSLKGFGSSISSLSNLNILPFDEIKMDGRLAASNENESENRKRMEEMFKVAEAMKLETVAEHVNARNQEDYLKENGCKRFQGSCYSPPLPLQRFEELAAGNPTSRTNRTRGSQPEYYNPSVRRVIDSFDFS